MVSSSLSYSSARPGSAPFVCIKLLKGLELAALLAEAAVNPIDLC